MSSPLQSPFPYFGGKATIAHQVWAALGTVQNYVEPFFGSGAVLLARPAVTGPETVNDKDGMISNFWRALQADPEAVATYADWPVLENDLHARHAWLVGQKDSLTSKLEGDPEHYDAKIAGWWVWGMACWIGGEFCSGKGPWHVEDGELIRATAPADGTTTRQMPDIRPKGIKRRRVHLGNKGEGIHRKRVHLNRHGQGIRQQSLHGTTASDGLHLYFQQLATRLRRVRVASGDWTRVCGPTVTIQQPGITGVFLDPPYGSKRDQVYTEDSYDVAVDVQAWCKEWGNHPRMRIVLAGHAGEHEALAEHGWRVHTWKAHGGYSNISPDATSQGKANRTQERLWISPHCLGSEQLSFFAERESA